MASVVRTWFDKDKVGFGGQFGLERAGKLYYAILSREGVPEGLLYVGVVGEALPEPIKLADLGVTGALTVELEAADDGYLHAHIARLIPASDADKTDTGRRAFTEVKTDIRVSASVEPTPTPTPGDTTLVLAKAVEGLRAQTGASAADLGGAVQSAHDGIDAVYNRIGIKAGEPTVAERLANLTDVVGLVSALLFRPPTRDYGLPHELEPFVGTDFQQYLCATLIALAEYVSRLPEFPKADGTSILRS
jgi:hypothetical protein